MTDQCFAARAKGTRTRKLIFERNSYNRYLAIAARTIRRSLNEEKRLAAERRGDMELRFARWEVCILHPMVGARGRDG